MVKARVCSFIASNFLRYTKNERDIEQTTDCFQNSGADYMLLRSERKPLKIAQIEVWCGFWGFWVGVCRTW